MTKFTNKLKGLAQKMTKFKANNAAKKVCHLMYVTLHFNSSLLSFKNVPNFGIMGLNL